MITRRINIYKILFQYPQICIEIFSSLSKYEESRFAFHPVLGSAMEPLSEREKAFLKVGEFAKLTENEIIFSLCHDLVFLLFHLLEVEMNEVGTERN